MGKLRSNALGTKFIAYDEGVAPDSIQGLKNSNSIRQEMAMIMYEPNILGLNGPRKMKIVCPGMYDDKSRVVCRPLYENETLESMYSSMVKNNESLLENQTNNQELLSKTSSSKAKKSESSTQNFKKGHQNQNQKKRHNSNNFVSERSNYKEMLVELCNKKPVWSNENNSFVLNFHGRVTMASVKNFQIIHPNDPSYICLQFGRISKDVFTLDWRYPMCPFQAFAVALSSFDEKLVCE